jgi:hypothetical protein
LHGDLQATRAALRLGGAIDDEGDWIGGKLVVVQTGDQLDRGDDERQILDFLEALTRKAKHRGGLVVVLNGNHEVMNVQGDFRYVTPGGYSAFADVAPPTRALPLLDRFPQESRGRAAAFVPGGRYAKLLAERPIAAIVGDTLFAHGGVLPEHVSYGLERMSNEVSRWMRAESTTLPPAVLEENAPIWTRAYGATPVPAETCAKLAEVRRSLGVRRLVVGHTVQEAGVNAACDGAVWRIDVGLSRHYGARPPQALEITPAGARVLGLAQDVAPPKNKKRDERRPAAAPAPPP